MILEILFPVNKSLDADLYCTDILYCTYVHILEEYTVEMARNNVWFLEFWP